MSEITFKSAGVSSREIDLSGATRSPVVGVPAGVIGTAVSGPAFVPVTVGSFAEFTTVFGEVDSTRFGMLAAREWLRNATALTYVRVLGAGDGTRRTTSGVNSGKVTSAGFVAGAKQVQASGLVNENPYAYSGGPLGRSYFLGCYMSESAGSTVFSRAGIQTDPQAVPIIRGVLMVASGVVPALSSAHFGANTPPTGPTNVASNVRGLVTGSVGPGQSFVLILNGHRDTAQYRGWITASFDEDSPQYISRAFNTDPLKIEQAGHFLYTHYDVHPTLAAVTGANVHTAGFFETVNDNNNYTEAERRYEVAFILSGSAAHNSGTIAVPNFEGFEERYKSAFSPFVVTQTIGGSPRNLFRIHALNDGAAATTRTKITIENITKPLSNTQYGTFDLLVRSLDPIFPTGGGPAVVDSDENRVVLEAFRGLTLDPNSQNYIARRIGDRHTFFDFDRATRAQKIVSTGDYENGSNYIRVEVSDALRNEEIPAYALPFGFRGHHHLVTSGSGIFTVVTGSSGNDGTGFVAVKPQTTFLGAAVVPPVPFRENITIGAAIRTVSSALSWGVQFNRRVSLDQPNTSTSPAQTINSHTRYFADYHTNFRTPWVGNNAGVADSGGTVLDSDRFNNNFFSLERVRIVTGSDGKADTSVNSWVSASYFRQGGIPIDDVSKTRALTVDDLTVAGNRAYAKFSFFLQGGFDGVNIFDGEKSRLSNAAAKREIDDAAVQGGTAGPTVASVRKAIDTLTNKSDVDIQLLAVPGMRHTSLSDYAITAVENRFDALYIMDIEERDTRNIYVTSSDVTPRLSVTNTTTNFRSRALDSSFAAAYFPDVVMTVDSSGRTQRVPPSVAVIGAYSQNDRLARSWFAPAGQTRGILSSVTEPTVVLSQQNLDTLYDAKINPIISTPDGVVVFGQKTLLATESALDRVNVRRLLIEIRRQVRTVANSILFEPNRESTLANFRARVNPILQRVQEGAGVVRYRVQIDTSTTTQADVENNTIRGKIYVQPTRTAEFVALDFVVTNAGAEI
jgi:phage tail sheath protein FI